MAHYLSVSKPSIGEIIASSARRIFIDSQNVCQGVQNYQHTNFHFGQPEARKCIRHHFDAVENLGPRRHRSKQL